MHRIFRPTNDLITDIGLKMIIVLAKKVRFKEPSTTSNNYYKYLEKLETYFETSIGNTIEKLENFPKYVPRQYVTNFLSKYEIFKKILNVQGSIVECGLLFGGSLMSFAQFSAILEPINNQRKIIGFDTFSGFPQLSDHDKKTNSDFLKKGGLSVDSYEDLKKCISLYDMNRFVSHVPRVELVKGDATKTIPAYLEENPHTVVSLLYLDFDIYEPTKIALENFVPRMPKGAIIAFDELNSKLYKGETMAVLDAIGIRNLRIERFPFNSYMSYAILD